MYAVISTGGKQYRVKADDIINIELIEGNVGDKVELKEVLSVEKENGIILGNPVINNAKVEGEILDIFRDKKVIAFKMKRRKGYRKTKGHRQNLTKVKILKIEA